MKDDEEIDEYWDRITDMAQPNTLNPFQKVSFREEKPVNCWSSQYYEDGSPHSCFNKATTDVGLCDKCYEDIVPHG